MSLFKKNILKQYNILSYKDNKILLHCSRSDFVKAPFDGELKSDGTFSKNKKILTISNMRLNTAMIGKVKAGTIIGTPILSHYEGRELAYIGLTLTENGKLLDVLKYLRRQDIDEQLKPKKIKNKAISMEDIDIEKIAKESIKQEVVYEEDKVKVNFSVDTDEVMNKVLETIEEEK